MAAALARPLELHPSAGAELVVLPRIRAGRAEIGVYRNYERLREEVAAWRARGLEHAHVQDVAGGISFVELELSDPTLAVRVNATEGGWEITLYRSDRVQDGAPDAPTAAALLAGIPRRPAVIAEGRLRPLGGDATTYGLDAAAIRLVDDAPATWEDVDAARAALAGAHGPERAAILARLAAACRALGLPREAMAYWKQLAAIEEGPRPHLAGADAAIATRAWPVARDECAAAVAAGAPDADVLPCLAALSLATSDPPPAETGRALARVAVRPLDRLAAGLLLMRDGYAAEAAPLLAEPGLPKAQLQVAHIALGDALLQLERLDDARHAWKSAPAGPLDPVLEVRRVLASMASDGVRGWPAWVPPLDGLVALGGPGASDALYLLAQIHAQYGDDASEADVLVALWDADRHARASDVPVRLLDACGDRIETLGATPGREAEIVTTWSGCWRDALRPWVVDGAPLDAASRAWEGLGFADRALAVQRVRVQIDAGRDHEDAGALIRLAHLQAATGTPDQAVDTLAYTLTLAPPPDIAARLQLERGRALALLGRVDDALVALRAAAAEPTTAPEAALEAGAVLLRAGRCAPGVAAVAPALAADALPGPPGDLELASARCRLTLGDAAGAIADAGLALDRALDDGTRAEARWIASAAGLAAGEPVEAPLRSEVTPWAALNTEEQRQAAFLEELTSWRRR